MAITTALANSARQEFLQGIHAAANTYKLALIKPTATTWNNADKTYTNVGTPGTGAPSTSNLGTDEAAAGSGYTSGGWTLAGYTVTSTSDVASIDWSDISQSNSTISAIGAVIYNSSQSNKVIAVFDFGGTITSTNGTFSITIPTSGVGVVRF